MKKGLFVIVISVLLLSINAFAQQPEAVYKSMKHSWTVNADGTSDYNYRHELQILRIGMLSNRSTKGETFVVYNPDFEELKINEVYTIRKDGSRVNMPDNAFVEQLPGSCTDCGRFNHIKEMVMVHTGMELGCTIVVDYTIHRKHNLLYNTLQIAKEIPIEKLEIDIRVPADQQLSAYLTTTDYYPFSPTTMQTNTSFHLSAVNVLPTYADSYMPQYEQMYPVLRFYNAQPEYLPEFIAETLPESADAIGRVLNGQDARANILAIRNFVVTNIHLNNIDPALVGYHHSTAAETWHTGCGTPTDKAVLLAALLNTNGYKARVFGENYDEVAVTIDTLEYRLSVRNNNVFAVIDEAKDEVKTVKNKNTIDAKLDTITENYYRLTIPAVEGAPNISVKNLALVRTAPLQSAVCNVEDNLIINLPKGVTMMNKAVKQTLKENGVGSVSVVIKQKGKKIVVERKLVLEKNLVSVADYPAFRRLLVVWQGYDNLLLQGK